MITLDFEAVGKYHEVVGLDGVRVDGGIRGEGSSEFTRGGSSGERNGAWT